jgi:hypothetical protein
MRERLIWFSAGLLGLLLAAALAGATSRVTTPDVGLAGEPVSAGEALAPPATAGGTAQPVTALPARAVKRAKTAVAKKKKSSAKAARAAKRAAKAVRVPALASTAPKTATGPARKRTSTTAKPKPKATATVKQTTVQRRRPPAVAPALTTPTITVDEHGGDVSGKDGGDGGSGRGRGGGDD